MLRRADILHHAAELGFNRLGITPATPSPTLAAYLRWIEQGMQANMGYLARPDRITRRQDLQVILPGAQSLILVALDYTASGLLPPEVLRDPQRGRIASYAWGADYHDVLAARLEQLAERLGASGRVYVDTGALLERSHAQQAGLGFIGKNTMLIHPRAGSTHFIGEILTTEAVDDYDLPHRDTQCGTCTRCLQACPTDAFPRPYVLDARRCISYHTIENKGWIDRDLRPQFGNWVYGCDVCQDVCPWQRFAPTTSIAAFWPLNVERAAPPLKWLLTLDESTFQRAYAGSAIFRIKHERLLRNACIAAGNSADAALAPALIALLNHPAALVRGHAAWALHRLIGADARPHLRPLLADADDGVRGEIIALGIY